MDDHAQNEIKQYATVMGNQIVSKWVPECWKAFLDYGLNSMTLSGAEVNLVRAVQGGDAEAANALAAQEGWTDEHGKPRKARERKEAEEKLARLGLVPPWNL
jgi:thymidylate synthase (FAD)